MSAPLTIYAPLGMLGYGFPEPSLEAALEHDVTIFGMDAGSTDPGRYYLGVGRSFTSRTMVKRDLDLLLPAARRKGVPLVIGSAGGAGGAPHLAWTVDIVREVAAERGLRFRMAVIQAEQSPEYLRAQLKRGAIADFETGRELTIEDIDACSHIVGQMGVEPVIEALESGAKVVVAGRAFDAASPRRCRSCGASTAAWRCTWARSSSAVHWWRSRGRPTAFWPTSTPTTS